MANLTRNITAPARLDPDRRPAPRGCRSHPRTHPVPTELGTGREERGPWSTRPVTRVLVAGGDPLVRAGVAAVVDRSATLDLAGTAESLAGLAPHDVSASTAAIVAEVTLGDLDRLDGLPPVVHVAARVTDAWLLDALWGGVRGVLLHGSVEPLLDVAVGAAVAGGVLVDPGLTRRLVEMAARGRVADSPTDLTVQELRVVRRLPGGRTNREIAAELGLSPQTVKGHLRRAMRKLGAVDRRDAEQIARREGLLDPEG